MATRISPPQNKTYYINPAYLTFVENSGYGANLIQVSASSSCYISVYDPANGIGYSDADRNYQRWKVTAYNNKFPNNEKFYIYIRLERSGASALVIYDTVLRGVKGGEITVSKDENGNDVYTEAESTQDNYWFIKIGEVGATDGTSIREITYDTGYLTSDEGRDASSLNEMWELDKYSTPWLIRAKQWLSSFTVKGFVKLIGGLIFSKGADGDEKPVTDIKRSTDSDNEYLLDKDGSVKVDELGNPIPDPNYVPVSDETLPSTKYLHGKLEGFDDKYLRKDQDDRTPHSLSVGGKTTAEGGIQIGSEFVPGLMGYGANIDEKGQAELHSLFVRTFLEVPELRYNRITVRMGDEINSVSAGIIERVEPAADGSGTGTLWLKLEDGEFGSLEPDDLVMQIFSDMQNPDNNADDNSDDGKGNRTMKGFATVYFEVVSVSGDRNEKIEYKLREDAKQIHPYAMGPFSQRGNRSNAERQTIIYQGIFPKPYTRYMKNVNDWEFTSDMIGMQIGYLGNLSVFGLDMSGYSAYVDNLFYKGFVFELTPQQKAELSAYSVSLTEDVGSIRVDSEGNIIAGEYAPVNVVTGEENVVTSGENVVTGEYLLQTRVQVHKGAKELAYTSGVPEEGQFTCSISGVGCTAGIANGVISVTSVEDFSYCYVKIETLCEGKAVYYRTYQVKVIKDGTSAFYADIDNEMDSVACDEKGKVMFGLPVSCNVSAWYGQRQLDILKVELSVPEGVTAVAVQDEEESYTGKVEVSAITAEAADTMQIGITVYAELFGETEFRKLTFTVNKVKQGESAVLYKLLPSVDSVKVNDAGTADAENVSCKVLKVTSLGAEELSSLEGTRLSMKYRAEKEGGEKGEFSDYTYLDAVGVDRETRSISFRLYQDGLLIDSETVPVVKDGNAIKEVGEFYLATSYGYGEGVTREDGPWGTWVEGIIPEISEEKRYLWNYEVISYTGTEPTYTEPAIIAMWTKDGKGVKDVYEWYQVNDDKDNTPAYPHIEGDAWVRDTAPVMREDAKYLWNYEEILWTDDSVTYTEPAMIGAKGEAGATTPVLSVSHGAVSRNSLGSFDPATVIVSVRRGMDEEELWISAFGIRVNEDGTEDAFYLGSSEAAVSKWNVELKRWSVTIDKNNISSVVFRAYLDFSNDYNAPGIAQHGITFVQQGEVGEAGPMPRNRGKYDGSTEYFYNDEYRDYVWDSNGFVWIRQGRGLTEGTQTEGAIKGIQPSTEGDTEYWAVADRKSLTAIDTALIDEANIAGFMFKDGLLVSQENDPRNLKANIILDGSTGKLKCNDAEVKGLITVDNIEYDIQRMSDGSLVESAMVIGPGEFILPPIKEGYTTEIKAIYPTVESRTVLPSFKFGHSQPEAESILFYDKNSRWWKYYNVVELEPNILYTFVSYNDNGTHRWMLTTSTGEGAPGSAPIVDSQLDINSTNPIQNKVVTGEIERIGPVVYNAELKYWKLDGDLLVTGGVTMYGSDLGFEPSTVMDAIRTDGETIRVNPTTKELEVIGGTGGGLDQGALEDYLESNSYLTRPQADDIYATPSDLDDRIDSLVNGAPAAYDTLKEIADVLEKNVDSIDDILKSIGNKADKATTLAGYGITDAKISNGVITLGTNSITPITEASGDRRYLQLSGGTLTGQLTSQTVVPSVKDTYSLGSSSMPWNGVYASSFTGKLNTDGTGGSWISGKTLSNAAISVSKQLDGALYYPVIAAKSVDGHVLNFGGYQNRFGFYGYHASQTENLYSWATEWDTSTGLVSHSGSMYVSGNVGAGGNVSAPSATIGGIKLYKSQEGVLYIEGNLVVKGGVTQYGLDSVTASTIMDAIKVDGTTIRVNPTTKELEVIGGTGGGLDQGALEDYLSSNKYLTQTTGDARYVSAIGTSGNNLTWTKNGATSDITVPYATTAGVLSTRINNSESIVLYKATRTDNTFSRQIIDNGWGLTLTQTVDQVVHSGYIATLNSNVASATKLKTARTIWGQSFDGSNDVFGNMVGVHHIYMNLDAVIYAKSANGVNEACFFPRWDDDITYLNYGSNGFHIRNNSNATTIFMLNDGSVGFGTKTPSAKVHVEGTVYSTGGYYFNSGDASLRIYAGAGLSPGEGNEAVYVQTAFDGQNPASSTYPSSYPARSVLALQPRGGRVGIKTATPEYDLHVVDTICYDKWKFDSIGGYIWGNTNGIHINPSSGSETAVNISMDGKMGVGVQTPSCAVDVAGTIKVTGQLISTVATGTVPVSVASITMCTNLNADMLDDRHGSDYVDYATYTLPATIGWYRIAYTDVNVGNNNALFFVTTSSAGRHSNLVLNAGVSYSGITSYGNSATLNQMSGSSYMESLTKARVVYNKSDYTNRRAYLEVYLGYAISTTITVKKIGIGWTTLEKVSTPSSLPSGVSYHEVSLSDDSYSSTNIVLKNNASNPHLKLVHTYGGTTYTNYLQAYNGFLYLGSSTTKAFRVDTNGNTLIQAASAYGVTIKRTVANGGAFTRYMAANQERYTWASGANNSYQYSWWYQDTGSGIDVQKMYLDSSGNLFTTGGMTMYSDIRKKTKLNDVELTLKQVADAPLIEHYYNSDDKKTTHVGSIAQYWAETIGNDWFCKKDNEGFYTMEIQNAALASAISVARELVRYESETDRKIRELQEENKLLRKEIDKLKTT